MTALGRTVTCSVLVKTTKNLDFRALCLAAFVCVCMCEGDGLFRTIDKGGKCLDEDSEKILLGDAYSCYMSTRNGMDCWLYSLLSCVTMGCFYTELSSLLRNLYLEQNAAIWSLKTVCKLGIRLPEHVNANWCARGSSDTCVRGWAHSLPLPAPSMGSVSRACEHIMFCMGSAYCLAHGSRSHALLAQKACQQ